MGYTAMKPYSYVIIGAGKKENPGLSSRVFLYSKTRKQLQ
ncbi:hypothetical protein HM1_2521 [Heliomicrobium modesticaldum Ice1]|uniref:Uncharacterized protein n=1 Tax=Heliobacterium modesticaldum (strain ATCC 51547 / Ice1) TaxID=498761 RepID=B0TAV6_HELMI|nr:hypothetical protein HM1_2521 [Heliomicrobium modesticaldum Ice1]